MEAEQKYPGYSTAVARAQAFAKACHQGQVDRAGQPYIGHLARVAQRLAEPELQVVAWLHDSIEDAGVSFADLAVGFGEATARAVVALTHQQGEGYLAYVARLREEPVARLVKISDLIDNSNLSRLPQVTLADVERQGKYNQALRLLLG